LAAVSGAELECCSLLGLVKILFWIAVVIALILFVLDVMIYRTVT